MREIKYKVIHNPTGVDITGVCLLDSEGSVLNWKIDDYYKDSDVTVLFYTGLKDKNGISIYEGDIVSVHSGHTALEADFGVSKYRVQWRETGACFDMMHEDYLNAERQIGTTLDNGGVFSIEVIGNIYENPHLLEDGE